MVGFPEAAAYYKEAKRVAVTGTPVRGEFFTLDREQAAPGAAGQPAVGRLFLGVPGGGPHER